MRLLRAEGAYAFVIIFAAMVGSMFALMLEALLFRSLIDVGAKLNLVGQRAGAIAALVLFAVVVLGLELPIAGGVLRFGRRLETRMRIAFLHKLPRLTDRYFHSRPISDMAERGHAVHVLRSLPPLASQLLRSLLDLIATVIAIAWIDMQSLGLAALAAVLAIAIPLLAQPTLAERDLRVRSHLGALGRFYLDAMLGLVPIRVHGAEHAVRREHEGVLMEWARASRAVVTAVVTAETLQAIALAIVSIPLVLNYLARSQEPAAVLLLLYWALNLPSIGEEIALSIRQMPLLRNTTMRLLEPLGALEASPHSDDNKDAEIENNPGVALHFDAVDVVAAGHTILENLSFRIQPGEHVAIVGASGAGKSSLVGTLLGWLRPSKGIISVDGHVLDASILSNLRRRTAWVDPAVHLWNRSLFDNLAYGSPGNTDAFASVIESAHLYGVLSSLPDGLQSQLGEGGALVSGGEGQRVRVGRAFLKKDVRLALLDEPFRGLDRDRRRQLLDNARRCWSKATLLCITHDVTETQSFDRVIVIDEGRIVEDDTPARLSERRDSHYRMLLDAEAALFSASWGSTAWRRLHLDRGRVVASAEKESGSR